MDKTHITETITINNEIINCLIKNNIFSIQNIPSTDYNISPLSNGKIKKFIYPHTQQIPPNPKPEKCIIWTYPLFNFNNGTPNAMSLYNNQPSVNIPKNIIMHFIKDNYISKPNLPQHTYYHLINQIKHIVDNNEPIKKVFENISLIKTTHIKHDIITNFGYLKDFIKKVNINNKAVLHKILKYFDIDNSLVAASVAAAPATAATAATGAPAGAPAATAAPAGAPAAPAGAPAATGATAATAATGATGAPAPAPAGAPAPPQLFKFKNTINADILNSSEFGNTINEFINCFANLKNINIFCYKFIKLLFIKYAIYQIIVGKYNTNIQLNIQLNNNLSITNIDIINEYKKLMKFIIKFQDM